jgi:16S rRNA (adenine1518-N6/adenine1519-N6)-dimethyltransferase
MQTLSEIRTLLSERGIHPKKRFGQHFLHDKNHLARLVDTAGVGPGDLVYEVGPGTGTLTEGLLDLGAQVVCSEIDRDLAALLRDRLGDRIMLIEGDCLQRGRRLARAVIDALGDRTFTLVANLPYQVASPLMGTLLIEHPRCLGLYITIQREVADRLLAEPGTKAFGALGVIIQALARVQRIATLAPTCFWPAPDVDSAMVSIVPKQQGRPDDPVAFARFVTDLFSKRRKQLGAILGRDRAWPEGVRAQQRPETLTVQQLIALSQMT